MIHPYLALTLLVAGAAVAACLWRRLGPRNDGFDWSMTYEEFLEWNRQRASDGCDTMPASRELYEAFQRENLQ